MSRKKTSKIFFVKSTTNAKNTAIIVRMTKIKEGKTLSINYKKVKYSEPNLEHIKERGLYSGDRKS